jgi:hypothetical protein
MERPGAGAANSAVSPAASGSVDITTRPNDAVLIGSFPARLGFS